MTLADVETVLGQADVVLPNKSAHEQVEARNHRAALLYVLRGLAQSNGRLAWSAELIRQTHLRLMNTLIANAGEYRQHGVTIVGSLARLISHPQIGAYLAEWVADVARKGSAVSLACLAEWHARFERIHPFSDGNGRTGRLLLFVQALQAGLMPPLVLKERKRAYYHCLERADLDGDLAPLELFLAESVLAANTVAFGSETRAA